MDKSEADLCDGTFPGAYIFKATEQDNAELDYTCTHWAMPSRIINSLIYSNFFLTMDFAFILL